jgi:hypothetical protein
MEHFNCHRPLRRRPFHEKVLLIYRELSKLCFQFGHATISCQDQSLGMELVATVQNGNLDDFWFMNQVLEIALEKLRICKDSKVFITTRLGRDCELVETTQERPTLVDVASMRTAHFQLASSCWMASYIKKSRHGDYSVGRDDLSFPTKKRPKHKNHVSRRHKNDDSSNTFEYCKKALFLRLRHQRLHQRHQLLLRLRLPPPCLQLRHQSRWFRTCRYFLHHASSCQYVRIVFCLHQHHHCRHFFTFFQPRDFCYL